MADAKNPKDSSGSNEQPKQEGAAKIKGPAQQPPSPVPDHWRLEKIFDRPEDILAPQRGARDLLPDCDFIFDTSALLTPYESDRDTLAEIARVLKPLAAKQRLFVPQRALREFANNRGEKINEFAARLAALRDQQTSIPPIPFCGGSPTEKAVRDAHQALEAQHKFYLEKVDAAIEQIRELAILDPITDLYRELFTSPQIIASAMKQDDLEEDFKRRVELKVPPGYCDKHIGDLVIWHSMVEHSLAAKKNVIFISNDIKEDWVHKVGEKGSGRIVSSRYELVYEFRRRTNGRDFVQVQFAELLALLDASAKVIKTVEAGQSASMSKTQVLQPQEDLRGTRYAWALQKIELAIELLEGPDSPERMTAVRQYLIRVERALSPSTRISPLTRSELSIAIHETHYVPLTAQDHLGVLQLRDRLYQVRRDLRRILQVL